MSSGNGGDAGRTPHIIYVLRPVKTGLHFFLGHAGIGEVFGGPILRRVRIAAAESHKSVNCDSPAFDKAAGAGYDGPG